jgi:hypothetical protein
VNESVKKLIPAIASYVKDKDAYLSKTKLLKLLYLFDVEYYRIHRQTFTDFQWKFFHLGPWTNEFDPVLEELEQSGVLVAEPNPRPEYDSKNYIATEDHDIDESITSIRDKGALLTVLDRWAERPLGEILDYVYFYTQPMEHGIRNASLDFSLISGQPTEQYKRSSSGKAPAEVARLREAIREKQAHFRKQQHGKFEFTAPRYDEEFFKALSKLDQAPA